MRILTISNTPHDPNQGSGYVITGYVEGLRARGHEVDAYGPEDYLLYNPYRGKRYVYPLMMAWFGVQRAREKDYDLIECYGGASWLLAWLLAQGRPGGAALVHHSNGVEPHSRAMRDAAGRAGLMPERQWFQVSLAPLHAVGLRAADAIVTVSDFDAAYARAEQYVPARDMHAISNPLPDAMLGRSVSFERPRRAGYCGMWTGCKGKQALTEDVPRFLRAHPDWTFSLVGVGDDFDPQAHFPADVRDRIEVIPFLPREELAGWYERLAVFVCPSAYESFGLVQAEAMACGAALAATKVGYAASLEDRETVLHLSSPQDPRLFDALDTLARNDALRRRIAENGYEAVQDLRWENAVDRLEAIYEDLVQRRKMMAA